MERRFAFFPYLKTTGMVRFRNVVLRSTGDLSGVPQDVAIHIATLASMFFLRDDLRIKDMAYSILEAEDEQSLGTSIEVLTEFQSFIRYVQSAPHEIFGRPFLTSEHGSLFVFRAGQISRYLLWNEHHVDTVSATPIYATPNERDELDGFDGLLDQRSPLWVAKGSRIYPPCSHMWLNISQDLLMLEQLLASSRHATLRYFLDDPRRDPILTARVLKALRWYNRSVAMDVSEDVALVSLAIAFESLLGLPRRTSVTERFKDAVTLLLGPVPRLDSFLAQFYDTRSDLVHDGDSESFMFRATDSIRESDRLSAARYRSLSSYARHIFQACLQTLVTGGHISARMNLGSMMTTNQQRFEQICRALSTSSKPHGQRLVEAADLIRDAEKYRFVSEDGLQVKTLITTCKYAVSDYLASALLLPEAVHVPLQNLATVQDDPDNFLALSLLCQSVEELKNIPHDSDIVQNDPHRLLSVLLDTVWSYTFPQYFHLKRDRAAPVAFRPPGSISDKRPRIESRNNGIGLSVVHSQEFRF